MKSRAIAGILTTALLATMLAIGECAVAAGDAEAGRNASTVCAACHGATGTSPNELWPNLTGQGSAYIIKQLKAFRAGTRKDPVMEPIASTLSDEDIENLAAFFSAQTAASADADQ